MKEDESLTSPVGTLFYEEYEEIEDLNQQLSLIEDKIQCRVGLGGFRLGDSQNPELTDYSDNIDVLEFLLNL